MKNGIFYIAKKELLRYFTDKRMLFTVILKPGLLIFLVYSFMGDAISSMGSSNGPSRIYSLQTPPAVSRYLEDPQANLQITEISSDQLEETKTKIVNNEADILLVFPENFEADVTAYEAAGGLPAPDVQMFYNAGETQSSMAYQQVSALLDTYESSMANKFDINRENPQANLAEGQDVAGKIMFSMLPFLLLLMLFSASMAVSTESIAGEKERGTIATLLVTPLKRQHLAIGKILALSIITLCGGISSFLGIIISLPKLAGAEAGSSMNFSSYAITDYLLLLVIIFTTLLLMVGLISIISAFAKSVKEAATMVTPLMILIMLVGISAMFGAGAQTGSVYFLIPFYNSVQAMLGLFMQEMNLANVLICCAGNLIYSAAAAVILTKMFSSEKIMFSK